MKGLKFKAWDKLNSRIVNVTQIDFSNRNLTVFGIAYMEDCIEHWLSDGEFELMQYIGRHDKNDNEIFEGYILRSVDGYLDNGNGEYTFTPRTNCTWYGKIIAWILVRFFGWPVPIWWGRLFSGHLGYSLSLQRVYVDSSSLFAAGKKGQRK